MVSSTEPAKLRTLGTNTTIPERYGVDFLWSVTRDGRGHWCGVQRKELTDLIASVQDGRLGKELAQMQQLAVAALIVEGQAKFTLEGELLNSKGFGQTWTRSQFRGVLWSVMNQGIWVDRTDSVEETAVVVQMLERWTRKDKHNSLMRRDAVQGMWGKPGSDDYARHLLMGLPGVGVELASRIVQKFGGVPWAWTVDRDALMEVEGVGAKKADQMMAALGEVRVKV